MYARAIYDDGCKVTFSVKVCDGCEAVGVYELELMKKGYEIYFALSSELFDGDVTVYSKTFKENKQSIIFLFNHTFRMKQLQNLCKDEDEIIQTLLQELIYTMYLVESGETDPERISAGVELCYKENPGPELRWYKECPC